MKNFIQNNFWIIPIVITFGIIILAAIVATIETKIDNKKEVKTN